MARIIVTFEVINEVAKAKHTTPEQAAKDVVFAYVEGIFKPPRNDLRFVGARVDK